MSIATMNMADLVGVLLGFFLTLSIFSYIFGDNALFRLAIAVFIGVSAGFAVVVAYYSVLWPQLFAPWLSGDSSRLVFAVVPLLLGLLLLTKTSTRLAWMGGVPMAYLVGVGVATVIGGAVLGTLFPQITVSVNVFDGWLATGGSFSSLDGMFTFIVALFTLIGTITTLAYFQFGARSRLDGEARRGALPEMMAWVGKIFIAITLGALFAGVYIAALTALVERFSFYFGLFLPPS